MEGYSREEAETKHPDPSFTTGDSEEDREKLTNVSSLSSFLEGNLEVEKLVKCPGRFEESENIVGRAEKAEVLLKNPSRWSGQQHSLCQTRKLLARS